MSDSKKRTFWQGFISGGLAIIVLGGVYVLGASQGGGFTLGGGSKQLANSPTDNAPTRPAADASKVSISKDDHVRGNPNADITMVEFSDFECPFCSNFAPTVKQALAEYGDDVRLIYKHFPLRSLHPLAQKAAEASECAADQGKFWEFHDELFVLNAGNNFTMESIRNLASTLGLNTNTFNTCLDSGDKADDVEADYQMGLAAGVSGTPGTFVNDQFIPGALPYAQVKGIIESQL